MQTSEQGVEFLERHEGVVLKAYRDPVGILTIGAGLTKASGVIDPKPGMRITKDEASRLLALSLRRNYEPTVAQAMPDASQHEFDGGVSFHFNTGAIKRASWVKAWRGRNWTETERRIKLWKKAGGRVLPGLVRRRHEEFLVIKDGAYNHSPKAIKSGSNHARIVLRLDQDEMIEIRKALRGLGYDPGPMPGRIERKAILDFQRDHDLTVDGIVGRATLSTLQRMIDARSAAKTVGGATAAGGATAGGGAASSAISGTEALLVGSGVAAVGLVVAGWLAWRYRDAIAVKAQNRFPKLAAKLRSL